MTARCILALALAVAPAAWPAAAARQKPAPAPVKATLELEDVERDAAADRKRDELIADLRELIPRMPETDRKADPYFQLAELWWEKARFVSLQEVQEHDEAYARWAQERKGPEPRTDTHRSDGYRKQALVLYQLVLDRYPRYERRDEVLFVAAHNLYETGNADEAIARYSALIREHPKSRLVPDAHVQMGEHWFARNDLARARESFEKAAAFRLPKLYPFALYKLAWCDFNAGDYRGAIAKFQEVIAYAEGGTRRDRIQLKAEALKDIVLAYARIDVVDGAVAYLTEKGGEHAIEAIDRLAATDFDDGKFEQSIRVYRLLQQRAPGHLRAPAWEQKILLAYDKLHRRDQVLSEMKRLVADYGPRSAWAAANAEHHQGAVGEASEMAESALRELVQDYHQEAIKTKSAATYRLARDIYRQYLDTFPHSEAAVAMRFYEAEILYALEEWDAAAGQYGMVVEADPAGTWAQRAGYNAILALEKSVDIAKGKRKKRELEDAARVDERKAKGQVDRSRNLKIQAVTKEVREEPIPENEQKLIAACDRYLEIARGAKDEIVIRYKAAFVLYERRHFVDAARRFGEIILRWPTDPWSQKAADLSLDILNVREEWLALSDLAGRFLKNEQLTPEGSPFRAEVARIGEGARFKYVMQLYEQKKDFALAAREFRAFVETYPKSEHAPKALYNAILIADKADQLDLVVAAGEQLLRDYPGADAGILQLTVPALASACERAGRPADAIRWYEQAQASLPSDPKAADWLYNAAVWREGLGDDAGALQAWQTWLRRYKARPEAARIAFNVGLILERQKDFRRAAEHWAGFHREWPGASEDQLLLARYKQGLALRELKTAESAAVLADVAERFSRLSAAAKGSAPVIDAAAHARFILVEQAFEEFVSIRFRSSRQAELVSALRAKNARLGKLLAAYAEVVAIGSPKWSEASFARIGEAYRDFNKGLLDAPMPRGLDPEQQDLYRTTLENQALPFEDKATEAFSKAVEVSQKSGVYSEWVVRAQDLLREYQPDAFGDVRRPRLVDTELARAVAPGSGAGGR